MKKLLTLLSFITATISVDAQQWNSHYVPGDNNGNQGLAVADMDNDGDEDIVSGGALTIHQNLGGGSYSISIDICSDTREFDGFEVADINNDSWLDVVAFSIDRDLLSWFRNNGDLTFSAEIELYDEFNGLRAIDVADLDADGHLDLLIGTMLPDKVMWMRNYGLANFGAPINISTSNNDPSSIHTADMDGDGDPDVLVSSTTDNEISWYANNGTGTFATAQIVTNSATTIFEAFPADLDNDGDIDVLGTSYSADMAMWFANDGSGVFSAPVTLASASNAKFVTAADVNNDGDVDVFVGGGLFKYYIENLGAGTFSAAVQVGGDQSIWDYLAPGDMDGDGDLDLVTSTLKVHAFNGSTYAAGVSVFTEIGADYTHAYQLDGTGHLELLMGDGDFVYYFLNEENNEVYAETQTISTEIDGLAYAIAADINGDGLNDVITCSSNDQKLAWYAGDGNGNFGAQQVIDNSLDSPFYLDIADLDNDGDNDILLTTGLYELSADVAFYRNEGSGNFSAPTILASADYDIEFNLKDVNLDGLLDIVYFIGYAVDELFWVQNLGGGNFSPATELYTLTTITSGILVNMDADPDYEICTTTSAGLSIIDDTGGMNYTAPVATGSSANEILGSGDFDSDGDDDLLMTKPVTPEFDGAPYHILVWLENLGNGNVGPLRVVSNFGNFYNEFTFADVDADGDLDVVTRLMWIENTYLNGCTDPAACNYEAENYIDDGSCCYGVCGCINPQSPNYDPAATCDDLTCIIEGCMDVQSCNYDSDATFDDGSCEYLSCAGCMDPYACNYDDDATIDDDSCQLPDGCTDPYAVNFNPDALCEDFSCQYLGCTDENACNYEDQADIDDGSCVYGFEGYVFHDQDGNGFYTGGFFGEPGLYNWKIKIMPENILLFADAEGYFISPNLGSGPHTIEVLPVNTPWVNTTPMVINFDVSGCNTVNFGFIPDEDVAFQVSGPCCIWLMDIHCNNGMNPGLWLHNTGTVPLHGTFTITCDPIFEGEPLAGAIPNDAFTPGTFTWNIDNQLPGTTLIRQIHILGPGVDYIGQVFDFNLNMVLYDPNNVQVFNESWLLQPTVVCAYDPNDKYAADPGYTEEHHFVLEENVIEYRIRFQNTGNFPAEDITIVDSLDISKLDLSTFEPIFASHNFMTCLHSDGMAEFIFNDIFLPDSTSDEPGSQGYVVFRIRPIQGQDAGTIINNTAAIYFEANPPIITNTTWHTLYECGELANFEVNDNLCVGDQLTATATEPFIETYSWYINDEPVVANDVLEWTADEAGSVNVSLNAANPLCEHFQSTDVNVNALPTVSISQTGNLLSSSGAITWQWNFGTDEDEMNPIAGAIGAVYEVTQTGYYSVTVSNEFGCTTTSNALYVTIISVIENSEQALSVFPNPAVHFVILDTGTQDQGWLIVTDHQGKEVERRLLQNRRNLIYTNQWASGTYQLTFTTASTTRTTRLVIP